VPVTDKREQSIGGMAGLGKT